MKKFLLATVALASVTFAAPALAADMPVKAAPPVAPALYNWSGIYIGVQGGAISGQRTEWFFTVPACDICAADMGHPLHGGFVGGEAGIQWQDPSSRWVFGIEGDGSWSEIEETLTDAANPTFFVGTRIRDFETIRGRIGYAFGPTGTFLVYVTAGGAFADQARFEGLLVVPNTSVLQYKRVAGWTVGGGAEYGITPWLSLKGEVLFLQFQRKDYEALDVPLEVSEANIKSNFVLARMGLNWRFGVGKGKGKTPPAVVAKY